MPNPAKPRLPVVGTCGECMFWRDYGNQDGLCLSHNFALAVTRYCKDSCEHFNAASGLRWGLYVLKKCDGSIDFERWWLMHGSHVRGWLVRNTSPEWSAVIAPECDELTNGTIEYCARALIAAVRKAE